VSSKGEMFMRRKHFLQFVILPGIALASLFFLTSSRKTPVALATASDRVTPGSLQAIGPNGKPAGLCPLKHTDVRAEISGFLSRVVVTQEFENPFKEKIEAVYTFPLPQAAAVDDMTMRVGERTVRGRILRREEAQAVYEAAKTSGQVASLLDQERPNIFTQSVANIMPGEKVTVEISYVETLKYEDGAYEFVFPMVVGPRYIPGTPAGKQGGGMAHDTGRVPDASRITPQVTPAGTRAGHDISIDIRLDAGVPVDNLVSSSHQVEVERAGAESAHVRLKDLSVIPNKDFILKYDVAGRRVEDAVLVNRSEKGGFFTLILQPPDRITVEDVTPKEIVFVLDTSGSMGGFPIEKAKEAMKLALDGLYPQDTFNLITFAGDTRILFPQPLPATRENLRKAQAFLAASQGYGGTEMMKAIRAALDPSDAQDHIRIVCFMTDGYVGNDMEIISEVQRHPNARVFSFGIGSSVNRFLLDKMAEYGRGEVEYVALNDDGSAAARRFHERVRSPLLTDISIDWAGLPVADVYPKRIPDLFSAKPVILSGRFTGSGRGVIKLKGKMSGRDFTREIPVELPESEPRHDVLSTLWARTRIGDLMGQDMNGIQQGNMREDLRETITQLGLEYRLMTQFTSFVAVEEMIVTDGGQPRRIEVPVEMPEGVSRLGVFGEDEEVISAGTAANMNAPAPLLSGKPIALRRAARTVSRSGGGGAGGSGGGIGPGRGGNTGGGNAGAGGGGGRESLKSESAGKQPPQTVLGAQTIDVDAADSPKEKASPEDEKRQKLLSKLHPSIVAVIERLKKSNTQPGADESKFVRDGKAELQIWLTEKSPEVLEQLKQLGFEVVLDPKTAKLVIGRLPVDKLAALANLQAVRYVAPQMPLSK
jgi:Ca-activated chloride channel family protein